MSFMNAAGSFLSGAYEGYQTNEKSKAINLFEQVMERLKEGRKRDAKKESKQEELHSQALTIMEKVKEAGVNIPVGAMGY